MLGTTMHAWYYHAWYSNPDAANGSNRAEGGRISTPVEPAHIHPARQHTTVSCGYGASGGSLVLVGPVLCELSPPPETGFSVFRLFPLEILIEIIY